MKPGKVPNDILNKLVLSKIKTLNKDVLLHPSIGEDCTAIAFDKYACVMSTDPITGATNEVGRLAVHISCNDIASCGVQPLGLLVTILCPIGTTEEDLGLVMDQICSTAALLNVEIIGGHTEVTPAVNRIVISTTAVGKALKENVISSRGAKPGDSIIMTKSAGIEGTAILANDYEERLLGTISKEDLIKAKDFMNQISAVKDGVLAGEFGASSMHDITEGGVLGAVWEIAEASGTGVVIYKDQIPVEDVTVDICMQFNIDPLRLISSGCMLITCPKGEELVKHLCDNGVLATIIGKVTENANEKRLISSLENFDDEIDPPEADELYKVL